MPNYLLRHNSFAKILISNQPLDVSMFGLEPNVQLTQLEHCYSTSLVGLPVYQLSENDVQQNSTKNMSPHTELALWTPLDDFESYADLGDETESAISFYNKEPIAYWPEDTEPMPLSLIKNLLHTSQGTVLQKADKCPADGAKLHRLSLDLCKDRTLTGYATKPGVDGKKDFKRIVGTHNTVAALDVPVLPYYTFRENGERVALYEKLDRFTELPLMSLMGPDDNAWYENLVKPYFSIIKPLHDRFLIYGDTTESNVIFSAKFNRLFFVDFECFRNFDRKFNSSDIKKHSRDWHIQRLIDIKDMCNAIVYNTTHYAKNHMNTPIIANPDVIQYLEKIDNDLEEADFCMGSEDNITDEDYSRFKSITIDSIMKDVERMMSHPHDTKTYENTSTTPSYFQI